MPHRVVPVRTVNKTIIGYQVPLIICLIWIKSRHLFQSRPHRPWYTLRPHRTRRASRPLRPLRTTAAAAGIWRTRTAWLAAAISCLAILVILTARIYGIPIHIITPIDILCHLAFCRGMLPAMRPVSADSMFSAFPYIQQQVLPIPSFPSFPACYQYMSYFSFGSSQNALESCLKMCSVPVESSCQRNLMGEQNTKF